MELKRSILQSWQIYFTGDYLSSHYAFSLPDIKIEKSFQFIDEYWKRGIIFAVNIGVYDYEPFF